MAVKPIPDRYHTVTPYLLGPGALKLIEFLKKAFDATETERVMGQGGAVMHAEVKIGDSMLMLSDGGGEWKPMPTVLYLYVTDADAMYKRALAAGAVSVMEPVTQFYGDRHGGVRDPSGNVWWIATHVEDVSQEELTKRAEEHMRKQQAKG
jgi:PhnB protein